MTFFDKEKCRGIYKNKTKKSNFLASQPVEEVFESSLPREIRFLVRCLNRCHLFFFDAHVVLNVYCVLVPAIGKRGSLVVFFHRENLEVVTFEMVQRMQSMK